MYKPPPHFPSDGLNNAILVLYKSSFGIKLFTEVDMPLNKKNQTETNSVIHNKNLKRFFPL